MHCTIRSVDQSIPLYGKFIAHQLHQYVYAFASLMISFLLYFNPSLPQATTAAAPSKCSETQVLSANYELFEVLPEEKCTEEENKCMVHDFTLPWEMTDDKVQSALTKFMVWASLTRDMEMQKGESL